MLAYQTTGQPRFRAASGNQLADILSQFRRVGRALVPFDRLQAAKTARDEILRRAAEILRVEDPRTLELLDEVRGSIWATLMRVIAMGAPEAPFVPAPFRLDEDDLFEVESRIIKAIATHEDAVIIGHGAAFILRNHPGAIRVFVHAPEPWRIAAAQRTYGLELNAARTLIRRSDHRRSRFIEGLAGTFWTDARLYDIAVDTSAIDISTAIEWLSDVVKGHLGAIGRCRMPTREAGVDRFAPAPSSTASQ